MAGITIKLARSDSSDLFNQLTLDKESVETCITPLLDAQQNVKVKSSEGLKVVVHDLDTNTSYKLTFKSTRDGYALTKNWIKDFVKRRELRKGDEIELHWDSGHSRFGFKVLQSAKAKANVARLEAAADAPRYSTPANEDNNDDDTGPSTSSAESPVRQRKK